MRWESVFQNGPEPALIVEDGRVVAANRAAAALFSGRPGALVGLSLRELAAPGQTLDAELADTGAASHAGAGSGEARRIALRLLAGGDRELDAELSLTTLPGTPRRLLVGVHPAGEPAQPRSRERQYRTLVQNFPDGAVVLFDADLRLTVAESAALAAAGFPSEAVEGKTLASLLPASTFALVEPQLRGALAGHDSAFEVPFAGRVFGVSVRAVRGRGGEPAGGMAVVQDITSRKHLEDKLRYLSAHDALTGLFNRLFFEEEMARLAKGRHFPISIVVADLDGLKSVNDRLGHAVGDELLRRAADVLRGSFRPGDVVARIGGDEFAVLLPGANEFAGDAALSRVRRNESSGEEGAGRPPVHFSLGLATANEGDSLAETLRLADSRMYRDKVARAGGG